MSEASGEDDVTLELDTEEFRIWVRGVVEAFEEVPEAEFSQRIGQTWEDSEELLARLKRLREQSTDSGVAVSLPRSAVQLVWRSLDEAMAGLGEVEFETRVGCSWEYGQRVLARLAALASGSAAPAESEIAPAEPEIGDINR